MSAGSAETVGARLVGRLRARYPEIVEAIFARVSGDGFDTVGSADPEYVLGLRSAVMASVDYALSGLESSGERSFPAPAAAIAQARRAARLRIGLDTLLRRYVAGLVLLEDAII